MSGIISGITEKLRWYNGVVFGLSYAKTLLTVVGDARA